MMLRGVTIQQAAARHCQTCVHALPACRSATAVRKASVAVEARARTASHTTTQPFATAAKRPSVSRSARLRVSAVALMPNVKDDRVGCQAAFSAAAPARHGTGRHICIFVVHLMFWWGTCTQAHSLGCACSTVKLQHLVFMPGQRAHHCSATQQPHCRLSMLFNGHPVAAVLSSTARQLAARHSSSASDGVVDCTAGSAHHIACSAPAWHHHQRSTCTARLSA